MVASKTVHIWQRTSGKKKLKHYNVDGDVPLCLKTIEEESKDGSSSNKKNSKEKNGSESSALNSRRMEAKSKMASGSKDMCGDSTGKKNKDVTFIVVQKNMRSMHSSERIEEMVCDLEGYRWDVILLLSETWRQNKSEIWETHHKHIFTTEELRIAINKLTKGKSPDSNGIREMVNKSSTKS